MEFTGELKIETPSLLYIGDEPMCYVLPSNCETIEDVQKRDAKVKELLRRWNSHNPLLEACQASIVIINETLQAVSEVLRVAHISPSFPAPPTEGIKQAIRDAGGKVYETAKEIKAALARAKE